jgi:hypothetical protein
MMRIKNRPQRLLHKGLGCLNWPIEVAPGQDGALNEKLPDAANRHQPIMIQRINNP